MIRCMGGGTERTVAGLMDVWGAILRAAVFCRRGPALFTDCSFGVGARYRDNVIMEGLHVIEAWPTSAAGGSSTISNIGLVA